jgi:RNA polymerase sigma factor (sigma-70 family)
MSAPSTQREQKGLGNSSVESSTTDTSSIDLLAAYVNGDESAARRLFGRYRDRLIVLAARQMSRRLRQRLDPEDVVQSACMAFMRKSRDGSFQLRQRGDFWNLLVRITINKVRNKVDLHTAAARSVHREVECGLDTDSALSREPSPEVAAILADEIESLLRGISKQHHRTMIEMFLGGCSIREIAAQTAYTQERVRQVIKQVSAQHAAAYADEGS